MQTILITYITYFEFRKKQDLHVMPSNNEPSLSERINTTAYYLIMAQGLNAPISLYETHHLWQLNERTDIVVLAQ
jgi:hypothetical protein